MRGKSKLSWIPINIYLIGRYPFEIEEWREGGKNKGKGKKKKRNATECLKEYSVMLIECTFSVFTSIRVFGHLLSFAVNTVANSYWL